MKKLMAMGLLLILMAFSVSAFERINYMDMIVVYSENVNIEPILEDISEMDMGGVNQLWLLDIESYWNWRYFYFKGTFNAFYLYNVNDRDIHSDLANIHNLIAQYNPKTLEGKNVSKR